MAGFDISVESVGCGFKYTQAYHSAKSEAYRATDAALGELSKPLPSELREIIFGSIWVWMELQLKCEQTSREKIAEIKSTISRQRDEI